MGNPELNRLYTPDGYAYAIGVVQALQKDFLGADAFRQLAEASTLEMALRLLSDSPYGEYLADGVSYQDLAGVAIKDLRLLHAKLLPEDALTGMIFIMADYANLKYLIKAFIKRTEPEQAMLTSGWRDQNELVYLVFEQPNRVDSDLAAYYTATLRAFAEYERTQDPAAIDLILDQACYENLTGLCRFRKAQFAGEYLALRADLTNLQTLFRLLIRRDHEGLHPSKETLQLSFLAHGTISQAKLGGWTKLEQTEAASLVVGTRPGQQFGEALEILIRDHNWLPFERTADELKVTYLRRAKLSATGYEPALAFFLAKESEIRQLQMALTGKAFGLPPGIIRERLWGSYV